MNRIYLAVLAGITLFFVNTISAQNDYASLEAAEENYLIALRHHNPGVVESAVVNVMKLKMFHPQKDYRALIS